MSASIGGLEDVSAVLEAAARERPPLEVTANLSVTVDGVDLAVHADGDRVRVQVPSVWAGARVLQAALDSGGDGLAAALEATGLTAEIRVGSAVIAVAGAGVTPGRLARLLPVGSVKVRARALAAAALRVR